MGSLCTCLRERNVTPNHQSLNMLNICYFFLKMNIIYTMYVLFTQIYGGFLKKERGVNKLNEGFFDLQTYPFFWNLKEVQGLYLFSSLLQQLSPFTVEGQYFFCAFIYNLNTLVISTPFALQNNKILRGCISANCYIAYTNTIMVYVPHLTPKLPGFIQC